MRYLFDTNACIALLNDASPPLQGRLHRLAPADVGALPLADDSGSAQLRREPGATETLPAGAPAS